MKKGDLIELVISDLAFGGAGVGRLGELVVFVEGVCPGDKVAARITKFKKNYAEAKLESVLEASPDRISAKCRHFGVCGGCSLQFLSYENQLQWKEKMVRDALEKIGGFRNVPMEKIMGCASPWNYRNKMEYTFGDNVRPCQPKPVEGLSKPDEKTLNLGFHPKKRFDEIFDLQECFLASPIFVEIVEAVKAWVREKNIIPFDPRNGTGVLRNLVIREGKNTGEIMVNLFTGSLEFSHEKDFVRFISEKFPKITSLYRTAVIIQRGHRTVIKEFHLAGKSAIAEKLTICHGELVEPSFYKLRMTLDFEILPQAFFQPNTKQTEVLYGKVVEFAAPSAEGAVLDLFCGTGSIGMFFADLGCRVTGVELNASAVENAKTNAAKNNLKNIEFHCGDIANVMLSLSKHDESPFDRLRVTSYSTLITDPPRSGIAPKSLKKIIELKIPKWIYVSCNPTTLARDLKEICAAGYSLKKVQPVDMFPQTYHVETICLLKRID